MSVFGGVMLFAVGFIAGSGAVILHQTDVRRTSDQLRRENEHLKVCAWKDRLEFESYKAYGDGYYDGSKNPMTDVERFADFLDRRHIDYRIPKDGEEIEYVQRRSNRQRG